ncbi:MAG: hypothetical protein M9944_13125 [Rhizobiaceae bacterium]|nr:hypothetical protein [Rhizobiaceae bacterium]
MTEIDDLVYHHTATPGNDADLVLLPPTMQHSEYREFVPVARAIVHKYLKEANELRDETPNTDLWSVAEDLLRSRIAEAIASNIIPLRDRIDTLEADLTRARGMLAKSKVI